MPKSKLEKLDPRSREAIFLAYLSNSKGYKLWDINSQKCIASRDVTFLEMDTQKCSDETELEDQSIDIPLDDSTKDVAVLNRGEFEANRFKHSPAEIQNVPEKHSDDDKDNTSQHTVKTQPTQPTLMSYDDPTDTDINLENGGMLLRTFHYQLELFHYHTRP